MTHSIVSHSPDGYPTGDPYVAIIGGGAAGLATAIFTARAMRERPSGANPPGGVLLIDGAKTLGAKILVSGGSRCNVTNAQVEAADFWRAGSPFVRQVLRAFPVSETIAFFKDIGVELKEEAHGKLFPSSNRSRDILEALLREANRLGVLIRTSCRVLSLENQAGRWILRTSLGDIQAERVVLATGGLSLPKTGSDGAGYKFAAAHGHAIVPTVPALEPLILSGDFHPPLSGIAHDAQIRIRLRRERPINLRGSLLWTHFGISGPLALNASRFMRRERVAGSEAEMTLSFTPDFDADRVDEILITARRDHAQNGIATLLSRWFGLAQAVSTRIVTSALGHDEALSRLTKEQRRALTKALTSFPLTVVDGRGYNFAEVTSGGVALLEVNSKTMESRLAPRLHFVGEILDVDGRIGGFNFQWAWATARVAARALSGYRR